MARSIEGIFSPPSNDTLAEAASIIVCSLALEDGRRPFVSAANRVEIRAAGNSGGGCGRVSTYLIRPPTSSTSSPDRRRHLRDADHPRRRYGRSAPCRRVTTSRWLDRILRNQRPDLQNILRQSYDNVRVTIDSRGTSNSQKKSNEEHEVF